MIEIKNIHKKYQMGETEVNALKGVSLTINEGDFVAIMGPSGSGKSTLMHILGLLDTPTTGSYKIYDKEVSKLDEDGLAVLRRDVVGFIFQQFNLLPRMTALENVTLPLIYSKDKIDIKKAEGLLERVGLKERIFHKPNELSGGQQQRVAIARSLINSPRVVLADEPTGNLDSKSSEEIMEILKELNKTGITVILVTHEDDIGKQAKRLIRMKDGEIHSDELVEKNKVQPQKEKPITNITDDGFKITEIWEFFKQGFKTLSSNKVRTALSMLGILIGVAAVVAMLALGKGAQTAIEKQLSSLGSNLLVLRPGGMNIGGTRLEAGSVTRLTLEDVSSIRENIPTVKEASPSVQGRAQVTYLDKNWNTQVLGTGPSYPTMHAAVPEIGRFFTEMENKERSLVAVVGTTIVRELFGNQNPISEMIKINKVNFRIIGVLPEKGATGFRDQDDVIIVPILAAMHRVFGKDYVDSVDVEIENSDEVASAQDELMELMVSRHKIPVSQQHDAFRIHNMADIQAALSESSKTMSLLLACIAAISLLVGGIGIMNIMLVSVTERTREIGLRKAIGARRGDILTQFLAESVVISAVGGALGIAIGWIIIKLVTLITGWSTVVSIPSVMLALIFSATIGILFGLYPARKASFLNPIDALRYE